jgi:hypothetical protein
MDKETREEVRYQTRLIGSFARAVDYLTDDGLPI